MGSDPERFFRPPYVGPRGWLGVYLDVPVDWGEVGEIVEDDGASYSREPLPSDTYRSRGSRDDMAAFFRRVRRSSRLLSRIPRLLLAWTALIVGLCALIWITLSFAGRR